jgi:hypothetical protein
MPIWLFEKEYNNMDINRDNYQEFAAEWLDGTLPADAAGAFGRFLDAHPDLRHELEEMREMASFGDSGTDVPASDFSFLKRSVNDKMVCLDNYLELVMARMDGELDAASSQRLETWLDAHPDCRREAALFEATALQPDVSVVFTGKESLRQRLTADGGHISDTQMEELIVASLEGDLSEADSARLHAYIGENKAAALLHRQFSFTFLKPDTAVVFPGKENLKQKAVIPLYTTRNILRTLAVAASIALLAGIFLFDLQPSDPILPSGGSPLVAEATPKMPTPPAGSPEMPASSEGSPEISSSSPKQTTTKVVTIATIPTKVPPKESLPLYHEVPGHPVERSSTRTTLSIPVDQRAYASALNLPHTTIPSVPIDPDPRPTTLRRTIDEFPLEQIRYYTGGGTEMPGVIGDISITRMLAMARPYDRLNNAGQMLVSTWVKIKERAVEEVLSYR